jgi:hypothetical protein
MPQMEESSQGAPLSYVERFNIVRMLMEVLELAFKARNWKFGGVAPSRRFLMVVIGHSELVAIIHTVLANNVPKVTLQEIAMANLLGKLHDLDEAKLSDVSWAQHPFVHRDKLKARAALFQDFRMKEELVGLLNRLDEKNGGTMSQLVAMHEDAHQIASLLELMAYTLGVPLQEKPRNGLVFRLGVWLGLINPDFMTRHAAKEYFQGSVERLRKKLVTDHARTVFEDLDRLKAMPSRSGIGWEKVLWQDLGFPRSEYPDT